MAAILGFVLERQYTTPVLADLEVTPHGHVIAWPLGEDEANVGHALHLGVEADLRANLRRLAMAADLAQLQPVVAVSFDIEAEQRGF
nr:hypothetical protein [Allochromatium palmeri]